MAQQTTTTGSNLPPYMEEFVTQEGGVLDSARTAVGTPYSPYAGSRVAGFGQDQLNAFDLARGSVGGTSPYQTAAATNYQNAGNLLSQSLPTTFGYNQQAVDSYLPYNAQAEGALQQGMNQFSPFLAEGAGMSRDAYGNLQPALAESGNYMRDAYSALQPGMQQGINYSDAGLNAFSPLAAEGTNAMRAGQTMSNDAASMFASSGGAITPQMISAYMNPYQQDVIDASMNELDRQSDITQTGRDSQATQAGAFGGSRRFIMDAEADRNLADVKAKTLAGLNTSNFTNAQSMAEAEMQRRSGAAGGMAGVGSSLVNTGSNIASMGNQYLNANRSVGNDYTNMATTMFGAGNQTGGNLAGVAGQSYGAGSGTGMNLANLGSQAFNVYDTAGQRYSNLGSNLNSMYNTAGSQNLATTMGGMDAYNQLAGQQLGLGSYGNQATLNDVDLLSRMGTQQQGQEQMGLDAAYQEWAAKQAYEDPYRRAQFLSGIATGTPTSSTTTSTTSTPDPSMWNQVLGGGAALAGIASSLDVGWDDISSGLGSIFG